MMSPTATTMMIVASSVTIATMCITIVIDKININMQ